MGENNSTDAEDMRADAAADDLIDVSYAALSSDDGFQDIMDRWDAYVDLLQEQSGATSLLGRVQNHINRARGLFSKLGPPNVIDPIVSEIQRSDAPCVALAAGNLVIEANLAAQVEWGMRSGERTPDDWLSPVSASRIKDMRHTMTLGQMPNPQILTVFAKPLTEVTLEQDVDPVETLAEIYPLIDEGHSGHALIIRALRQSWSRDTEAALRGSFGLTKGEIAVAQAFLESGNTDSMAAERQTSPATIRKQLKSIFAKTGVSNQAQLQKLLGLMSSSQRRSVRGELSDWQDPLGCEQIFKDAQGRAIAYTYMGADDGTPVLLSHGSLTGYVLHPVTQKMVTEAGIKIYVPSRAGFGHTDCFDDMSALDAARHINTALVQHLGLGPLPAIGLISGLVPLVYHAARERGAYARLLVIGGCVPIFKQERLDELPINSRVLLSLQKKAPHVAALALQAGFRQVMRHGPSYMVRKIYGNCEIDRQTLRDLSTLSLMVASSKMLTVHGTQTFERELPLINYDWEDDFAACGLSLTVLQGLSDPVFRPKEARAMAGSHAGYRIIDIEGAGQLVFLQAPEAVGRAIIDFVKG